MFKKVLSSFLLLAMMMSSFALPALAEEDTSSEQVVCTQEYTPVCGTDNTTYSNSCTAEANEVDVSYEGECHEITDPDSAEEETSDINFAGMLLEVGSTDIPTTLVIRENGTNKDFTVSVTSDTVLGQRRDQYTKLSDWIPGDQIRVIGKKNENTDTVEATVLVNLAIKVTTHLGANGWVTAVDEDAGTITYQWANKEHTISYDDDTRFVVGLKNPASAGDLKKGDRVRGRLLHRVGADPLAKIVIVLRRGSDLFMKIRTFKPNATLVRMDSTIVPTTIQVRIDKTPGLREGDVNNLIGTEGRLVTVNITENTKIVRKFFGRTTLGEFSIGDKLQIVGRVNNDDTVDAKIVKNNSIWKTSTIGAAGVVTEVNVAESYFMLNWTPIKHVTKKQLKRKLNEASGTVIAQTIATPQLISTNTGANKPTLRARLIDRIKKYTPTKVGSMVRSIINKRVTINRIQHSNVKVGDLIKRLPARKIRVEVTDDTKIVIGTNVNGTLADLQVGDKIRGRGLHLSHPPRVVAETVVVVSSLPEIEEDLEAEIDDINEVVSEIVTDNTSDSLTPDTTTNTEEEVDEEGNVVEEEEDNEGEEETDEGIDDNQYEYPDEPTDEQEVIDLPEEE